MKEAKKAAGLSLVDDAVTHLRQVVCRPSAMFDPHATMAALEQVVNVAREKGDDRALKYMVILRQCRPLINSKSLQTILTNLVTSKEEAEVTKVVEKALKNASPSPVRYGAFRPGAYRPPYPTYYAPRGRQGFLGHQQSRFPIKCHACGQFGHIAKFCGY